MDIQLHYTESGSGFPLILLHGNGEDSTYFEHQIPALSKHFRVIAVDTRGHGKSPRGAGEFSIARFAEDLHDFMDSHSVGKAHLLGFSDGANIALAFALKYPQRVGKLILNGGNLRPWGVKFFVQLPVVLGWAMAKAISVFDKKAVAKAELLELMVTQPSLRPDDLVNLHIPTLVIAGKRDMIRESHTREIHRAIRGSEVAIIEGDHFVAHGNPEEFNRAVTDFLKNKEQH
jgi:pimeloyl-ACP methyl ester carboxylesterase